LFKVGLNIHYVGFRQFITKKPKKCKIAQLPRELVKSYQLPTEHIIIGRETDIANMPSKSGLLTNANVNRIGPNKSYLVGSYLFLQN
jgi:hypothetical protein